MAGKRINDCLKCEKCKHFVVCGYVRENREATIPDFSQEFPMIEVDMKCKYFEEMEIKVR